MRGTLEVGGGRTLFHGTPYTHRRSKLRTAVAAVIEFMEARVLLSGVPTTNPAAWMASLPDGIPLTDISLPGTYNSAAGPGLQDALLGSGSENEVNPPSPTNTGVNTAALVAYASVSATTEAALL